MPIDPGKVYTVATNNFMRNGGDGYAVLRDQGTNAYDFGPGLEEVLASYLAEHPDYPSRRRGGSRGWSEGRPARGGRWRRGVGICRDFKG